MGTNLKNPDIERRAMWFLINQPQVLESNTVNEKWFSNNSYRILCSYINLWGMRYTNADQIAAAFGDTPFGKKLNVQGIFKSIQSVDMPEDPKATFKILKQVYNSRELQSAAQNVFKDPCEFNYQHLKEVHDEAQKTDNQSDFNSVKLADEALQELEHPNTSFITTYPGLDRYLGGGLVPNQLMVIGARPSVGKTAFALNLAVNAILQSDDLTVEIFSLEMSNQQNMHRIYANVSGIPLNLWKNPAVRMSDGQKKAAVKTIKQVAN